VIYKKEAFEHFEKLLEQIRVQTIQMLLKTDLRLFQQPDPSYLNVASDAQIMAMLDQAQQQLPTHTD
jgi:preprotein translocase subunit SecA